MILAKPEAENTNPESCATAPTPPMAEKYTQDKGQRNKWKVESFSAGIRQE
jgi:hypothetical protein